MSVLVSIDRPWSAGITHIAFAASASAIAVTSAGWLWWVSKQAPKEHTEVMRKNPKGAVLRWPLILMALVCLTSPAFSKLVPYVATYSPALGTHMPLVLIAVATVVSQPGWVALLRRLDDVRAGIIAGIIMSVAGLMIDHLWLAALLVGVASGGFGTVIWSGYAIAVADLGPLAAAPAFAKLTAIAKVALAVAALGIAGILTATDYRDNGAALLPLIQALTLAGGIVTAVYLGVIGLLRPRTRAE